MTSPERRGVSTWKILLLLGAGLSVLSGVAGVWMRTVEEQPRSGMKVELSALLRGELDRSGERPVLRGNPVPGNAWDDYQRASPGYGRDLAEEQHYFSAYLWPDPGADRVKVAAVVAAQGPALSLLRLGTGRSTSNYVYRNESGLCGKPYTESGLTWLGSLAACEGRLLAEEGKGREAAERLLDVAQFARDCSYMGPTDYRPLFWTSILGQSLDGLYYLLKSGILTADDLAEVGRELAILDGSFRDPGFLDPLLVMETIFRHFEVDKRQRSRWSWWEDSTVLGPSRRLPTAEEVEEALGYGRESARAVAAPWGEFCRISADVKERLRRSRNPLLPELLYCHGRWPTRVRQGCAKLRLLRIAIQYRLSGEVLDLEDPFGVRMRHQETASTLKAWSVGASGVDDGGTGGWREGGLQSIVLEIDRRN